MKNIILPLGVSDNAQHSLSYAIDLAASFQGVIYVMDSFNPSFPNAHLLNVKEIVGRNNFKRLKALIQTIDHKGIKIQLVNYEGDLLSGIAALDEEVGIDLVVSGLTPNANDNAVFLGPTAGRLVKKTNLPVWIIPEGARFKAPKKALFAFKRGKTDGERSLEPLRFLIDTFKTKVELLLVKVPGKERKDFTIDREIVALSDQMTTTENGTVYQGVLEYFHRLQPDLLTVFARKRGFFEKLIESDVVYKKDFYTKTPFLVLKNRP
ncbi:MAG: universal stress protein [Flavobacteriaceae bacterium]